MKRQVGLQAVLKSAEEEIRRLCADLPENLKLKRARLTSEERRISNFIEFIGNGKGTQVLGQALELAEQRATTLRDEITAPQSTAGEIFQAPPVEWVAERVRGLQDLLERETSQSALLLRDVLGPVTLKPMAPQIGKPYSQAETTLQIVDLLHDPEGGSNWLRKWGGGN